MGRKGDARANPLPLSVLLAESEIVEPMGWERALVAGRLRPSRPSTRL